MNITPAARAKQRADRAARLARRNAAAPPAAPPAAAVAAAAPVQQALPAPAPPAPAQPGGPQAAAPVPAPAQGVPQQAPQGQAQPTGAVPAQQAPQGQAQPGGAPVVAATQAPAIPAPAAPPAPAQATAPHAKYLPAAYRVIHWKQSHKGQLKRTPPLLPAELLTLFATLIDDLHTRGEWEKHDGHSNNTTDGVSTTLGLLKSDFHGASNPHRQNGKAKRARKMENKQKRLPAQVQFALSKAESVVAGLILLLDTAVAAQQVPRAQFQQAQAQPGAPAPAPAQLPVAPGAAIGGGPTAATGDGVAVKWRSMPEMRDFARLLQVLSPPVLPGQQVAPPVAPPAAPPAAPHPATVTPSLMARYNALTHFQQERRKMAVLFEKYYYPGHSSALRDHYENDHVAEVAKISLPKPGPWPGLSTLLSRSRWRASVNNREYIPSERNVLIPPRIDGIDENGDHYPPGDLRNTASPAIARMTRHNIAAMRKPSLPENKKMIRLNDLTRKLIITGLRQLRPLGEGGFGFTALFRVRRSSSRTSRALFFVVKAFENDKRDDLEREKGYLRHIDQELTETKKFVGSRHIVQLLSTKMVRDDLIQRNFNKREQAEIEEAKEYEKLDNSPNFILMEFMGLGDLQDYIGKMNTTGMGLPSRGLWRILCCLTHQLIALKYPPLPGASYEEDEDKSRPIVKNEQIPDDLDDSDAVVHFDIDPQNVLMDGSDDNHQAFPICKLSDFGLSQSVAAIPNSSAARHSMRITGKTAYYTPEQFSDEWNYYPDDVHTNPNTRNWTAGNYKSEMNIYQMGLIMVNLITLEYPLLPAVPVLYCVKKPADADDQTQLNDNDHADIAKSVHGAYKALRDRNGTTTTEEADRKKAMSVIPNSDQLVPQRMSGEIGIDIMPYDKTLKYGWVWTYAALLLYTDPDGVANGTHKGIFDDDMLDCICLMMAHRPSDRIDLQELHDICTRKLNELGPEPEPPYWLDKRQSRDENKFTDGYLRSLAGLMSEGCARYNMGNMGLGDIHPYPSAKKRNKRNKTQNLAPETNYQHSTRNTYASHKWRRSYLNRDQQPGTQSSSSQAASSQASPQDGSRSSSQAAPQAAPLPASSSTPGVSFDGSGGSSGSTTQPAPQPAPQPATQPTSSSQQPQQAAPNQASSHH